MEYLQEKWAFFFSLVDVTKDGKVTKKDVRKSKKQFIDLYALTGAQSKKITDAFDQWWKFCIFQNGKVEQIPREDAFVQGMAMQYNEDKQKFRDGMNQCFNMIFYIFDMNNDTSISLNEYTKAFNAFGHNDKEMIQAVFEVDAPPVGGPAPLQDVVSSWVRFMIEENAGSKLDEILLQ
jgi:Ca2+-binding EF-hand superfamily protein